MRTLILLASLLVAPVSLAQVSDSQIHAYTRTRLRHTLKQLQKEILVTQRQVVAAAQHGRAKVQRLSRELTRLRVARTRNKALLAGVGRDAPTPYERGLYGFGQMIAEARVGHDRAQATLRALETLRLRCEARGHWRPVVLGAAEARALGLKSGAPSRAEYVRRHAAAVRAVAETLAEYRRLNSELVQLESYYR